MRAEAPGKRGGLQDRPHAVVVAPHLLRGYLLREVIPEALVGLRLDIGVDQRAPADAARADRQEALEEVNLEQPGSVEHERAAAPSS